MAAKQPVGRGCQRVGVSRANAIACASEVVVSTLKLLDDLHAGFVGTGINAMEDDVAGGRQVDASSVGDVYIEDEVIVLARLDIFNQRDTDVAIVVAFLVVLDAALVP